MPVTAPRDDAQVLRWWRTTVNVRWWSRERGPPPSLSRSSGVAYQQTQNLEAPATRGTGAAGNKEYGI